MAWLVVEGGKHQHIFSKLAKPFKMTGRLVQWASICARAFAFEVPQPNTKRKKCSYCLDMENGHHGGE